MIFQRKHGCTGKIPYLDEAEALANLKRVKKARRMRAFTRMEAYKCRHCPFWHLGHGRKRGI